MRKQYTRDGFTILNRQLEPWTPRWFHSEKEASEYLAKKSADNPTWDLSRHTIVPAKFTIKPKRP